MWQLDGDQEFSKVRRISASWHAACYITGQCTLRACTEGIYFGAKFRHEWCLHELQLNEIWKWKQSFRNSFNFYSAKIAGRLKKLANASVRLAADYICEVAHTELLDLVLAVADSLHINTCFLNMHTVRAAPIPIAAQNDILAFCLNFHVRKKRNDISQYYTYYDVI